MSKSFNIKSRVADYSVTIGGGIFKKELGSIEGRFIILCDSNLVEQYNVANPDFDIISIDANEESKDLQNLPKIFAKLKEMSVSRSDILVGVGGGVIQDITCFVASTYMRGLKWIYFPTTFLGMCDSCVGGKSSINVSGIKNLVGNFHPPQKIIIDVAFCETLPSEEIDAGLCEAMKILFAFNINGDSFNSNLELLKRSVDNRSDLEELAHLTLTTKKWFIEKDEYDKKERQLLNYGHTFGHAIEPVCNFAIPHGVAVGIGMLWAIYFSSLKHEKDQSSINLESLIKNILKNNQNFVDILLNLELKDIFEAFKSDKKHTNKEYVCIIPNQKGVLERVFSEKNEKFYNDFNGSFEILKDNLRNL